jgi:hypothetical protein
VETRPVRVPKLRFALALWVRRLERQLQQFILASPIRNFCIAGNVLPSDRLCKRQADLCGAFCQ